NVEFSGPIWLPDAFGFNSQKQNDDNLKNSSLSLSPSTTTTTTLDNQIPSPIGDDDNCCFDSPQQTLQQPQLLQLPLKINTSNVEFSGPIWLPDAFGFNSQKQNDDNLEDIHNNNNNTSNPIYNQTSDNNNCCFDSPQQTLQQPQLLQLPLKINTSNVEFSGPIWLPDAFGFNSQKQNDDNLEDIHNNNNNTSNPIYNQTSDNNNCCFDSPQQTLQQPQLLQLPLKINTSVTSPEIQITPDHGNDYIDGGGGIRSGDGRSE
ncbi:7907_t:CDS:2, partial [Entrophospora sp. SA101]